MTTVTVPNIVAGTVLGPIPEPVVTTVEVPNIVAGVVLGPVPEPVVTTVTVPNIVAAAILAVRTIGDEPDSDGDGISDNQQCSVLNYVPAGYTRVLGGTRKAGGSAFDCHHFKGWWWLYSSDRVR